MAVSVHCVCRVPCEGLGFICLCLTSINHKISLLPYLKEEYQHPNQTVNQLPEEYFQYLSFSLTCNPPAPQKEIKVQKTTGQDGEDRPWILPDAEIK